MKGTINEEYLLKLYRLGITELEKINKEAFQKGVAKGYRMALQDLGIIKKEGEKDEI